MAYSATWFSLEQEGLLAQACLCNGLTALRRANLGDKKGLFYSAFFELSIGFERVLKLILILDHMANNKLAPAPSKYIEGFRHDLIRLFDATKTVCTARGLSFLDEFPPDSLPIRILDFLDRFADTGGRLKCFGSRHQGLCVGQEPTGKRRLPGVETGLFLVLGGRDAGRSASAGERSPTSTLRLSMRNPARRLYGENGAFLTHDVMEGGTPASTGICRHCMVF